MTKSALLFEMIDFIRRQPGITVIELASSFGRSERTIYRWLNEISQTLRMPLACKAGGYYLSDNFEFRTVNLTVDELLALYMSLKTTPFADGSHIKTYAESAWKKIRDASPSDRLNDVENMVNRHSLTIKAPESNTTPEAIQTIENAINLHHRLNVIYRSQSSNRVKDYALDPYAMVFRQHSWYVLGYCHEKDKVIQFKLARFQNVYDTLETFDPPDDFSVEEYFRFSWEVWGGGEPTTVKVRFSKKVAPMIIEEKRHPTQELFPQEDGSVIFKAVVSSIDEIAIWIRGYGKDAMVLEPESLRSSILEHARSLLLQYESSSN